MPATAPSQTRPRPSVFESALDRLTEVLDRVAPGARGELVHEFMMRNGYFEDPARADRLYQSTAEVDAYLDELRLTRATETQPRGLTGEQVVAVGIGFGLGLGVAYAAGATSGPPSR